MEARTYKDKKGRVLFVDTMGAMFETCWKDAEGLLHSIRNKALPLRNTREEAQADLNAYALDKELEAAEMPK